MTYKKFWREFMDKKTDPNAIINPSSGLLARNPTHIEEAKNALDQSDIVNAIKDTGVKRMTVTYDYGVMDPKTPLPLAGILKIRDMNEQEASGYCKQLMRFRPSIFYVHIKLGDYQNTRRLENFKTRALNANRPRFHTDVGNLLGTVLADKSMRVTEVKYVISSAEPGRFSATAEVYGTDIEQYEDDDLFSPTIKLEYIKTS